MENTINITLKEYRLLLQMAYASEFYLEKNLDSTKNRLQEYLNEFNELNNM